MAEDRTWIFIGGMPRSGTTLVTSLLNMHPKCLMYTETSFPVTLYDLIGSPMPQTPHYEYYLPTSDPQRSLEVGMRHMTLLNSVKDIVAAMCNGVFDLHPGTTHLGDKSPSYSWRWSILREIFPHCKIIFSDRDFDDTLESVMRQSWAYGTKDVYAEFLKEVQRHQAGCTSSLTVRLEDVEADPEAEVTRLLTYVGLSPGEYDFAAAIELVEHGNVNRSARGDES